MHTEQIYSALTVLFHDLFADDTIILRPETTADTIKGWDSLTHINLVVAVEAEFGIRMTTLEIEALMSVRDLVELIDTKLHRHRAA